MLYKQFVKGLPAKDNWKYSYRNEKEAIIDDRKYN